MKIAIATGGTGGHVVPALKTAVLLKQQGHELLLIGTLGPWAERIKELGLPVKELHAIGLSFDSVSKSYQASVAMIKAMRHAFVQLKKFSPDVVAGFGGYGGFPAVMSARILRYPTIIHEQNVFPGRANRLLAYCVDRVAVSFEASTKYFPARKTIVTGCPCHYDPQGMVDKADAMGRLGLEAKRKTLLILGGSQGSHRVNLAAIELVKELSRDHYIQVVHISGRADHDMVNAAYRPLGIPFKVYDFCKEMPVVLQLADVAVARAGALTVTETALAGIPTVFIPYPYAGGHQRENALALTDIGAARMIDEDELTEAKLFESVISLLQGQERILVQQKLKAVAIADAAERLAREITGLPI